MPETSASLLERVRDRADSASWRRLIDLYSPLLRHWLRVQSAPAHDADDLTQEVLAVLARRLPEFRYDPGKGRFRGWLRGVVANVLRSYRRRLGAVPSATGDSAFLAALDQLEDEGSDLARSWEVAHDWHVLLGLLRQIEPEFEPRTVQAFRRTVLDAQPAVAVAAELGLSPNAVAVAKCRVFKRLRQEMAGLAD